MKPLTILEYFSYKDLSPKDLLTPVSWQSSSSLHIFTMSPEKACHTHNFPTPIHLKSQWIPIIYKLTSQHFKSLRPFTNYFWQLLLSLTSLQPVFQSKLYVTCLCTCSFFPLKCPTQSNKPLFNFQHSAQRPLQWIPRFWSRIRCSFFGGGDLVANSCPTLATRQVPLSMKFSM